MLLPACTVNDESKKNSPGILPLVAESREDPAARGDILGFQQRFTALPIRGKYIGAIYSDK